MLSIVIPVRNGASTLGAQLEALVQARKPATPFEVVVADNGSTDDTAAVARSFSDRLPIRVVDAGHAAGSNVARNCGVRAAVGDRLLFCDADDEVDAEWLVAMDEALGAGASLVAGPIDYRRLNPPEIRAWRGADQASVSVILGFLPSGHTANLACTRAVFDRLGGFDEAFIGGDDVEFCWRTQLAGFELRELPTAVVHYRLRPSLRALWRQAVVYGSAEVDLYRAFRRSGVQRRSVAAPALEVWWLITRLPFAGPLGRRGAWVRRCGQFWGRLRTSVRTRTLYW